MIADLQISNGDKVAKEIGGSTAFVATDVRARTVVSPIVEWSCQNDLIAYL